MWRAWFKCSEGGEQCYPKPLLVDRHPVQVSPTPPLCDRHSSPMTFTSFDEWQDRKPPKRKRFNAQQLELF